MPGKDFLHLTSSALPSPFKSEITRSIPVHEEIEIGELRKVKREETDPVTFPSEWLGTRLKPGRECEI